jgi:hypothetical protein
MNSCAKCAEKSSSTTLQHSRKFNHGNVDEPIPDNSHIFGGKWYYNGVRKWGLPPSEIIEFALQYQKEARGDFIIDDIHKIELYNPEKESTTQEMPRAKKVNENTDEVTPIKRSRKPKVATENPTSETDIGVNNSPVKRTRKPKIAPEPENNTPATKPPQKIPKKKTAANTPYSSLISSTNQLVHKEVSLPTHIETQLEQIDSEGYQIEYIKLSLFEANGVSYYRDIKKNKLYKKVKDKGIGSYIGRWNPDTDSIITNIPDSDDEE